MVLLGLRFGWLADCGVEGRLRSAAGASGATLEGSTFVFAEAAPDAGVLAGLERVLEAHLRDGATTAHSLGLIDLVDGGPGVPHREKQFGVGSEASSVIAPVHVVLLLGYCAFVTRAGVVACRHKGALRFRIGI
jgi:hypothetical protein